MGAHISSIDKMLHAMLRLQLAVDAAAYSRDLGKISQDILHALVDLHLVDRSVWQKLAAAVGTLPLLLF